MSDAPQINTIFTEPLNSPFAGVVDADASVSVQEQKLEAQQRSTAKGENAWMLVILKDPKATDLSVEKLAVKEGVAIGYTGFNSFPFRPSLADATTQVVVGDTGILIDYRFARKGYAIESLSAVIEYGFVELKCGLASLDTKAVNEPIRNLLRTMCIGEGTIRGQGSEQEVNYLFDRDIWEGAKKEMKLNGKWYL